MRVLYTNEKNPLQEALSKLKDKNWKFLSVLLRASLE